MGLIMVNSNHIELIKNYHVFEDPNKVLSSREYTKLLLDKFMANEIAREELPRGFHYSNLPFANEKKISENPLTENDFETVRNAIGKGIVINQKADCNKYFGMCYFNRRCSEISDNNIKF